MGLISPYIIILVIILLLVFSKLVLKNDYMNLHGIIKNHYKVFKDSKGNQLKFQIFINYIIPIILSLSINEIQIIEVDQIEHLIIIFSILISMLFTLLVLIINSNTRISNNKKIDASTFNILKDLVIETYSTVIYEILISIILLIISFIYIYTASNFYMSILIYYLIFHFLFNLLIILKRVNSILTKDIDNQN